ncbi:MAG TPA: sensor histidine kinase [Anaerolineales bacterium]|nr:sensor histidine kinase [Anaerolineales bacterium]
MESINSQKTRFIELPFYIFVSVVLGAIAVIRTIELYKVAPLVATIGYVLIFLIHIVLYWIALKLSESGKSFVLYYIVQSALITALVLYPYSGVSRGVMLGSAVFSIMAQSIGLWGNTWKSFLMILYFAALALGLLYLLQPQNYWGYASSLLVNGGFIILFLIVLNQQLTERQKAVDLAESLESANAQLAASAAKIEMLTLQNERQRMARELHDTLSQGVAGHVLQLEAIKAHLKADRTDRAATIVDTAIVRARTTLAESRAVIDDLRDIPADITDAIVQKVERFKQSAGIPCELNISIRENQLPIETTNHALDILSESLMNVIRHARATQVHVKFHIQNQTLKMEVYDNGVGFDTSQQTSGHYGLVGMHERARLTGGTLKIESNSDGTCVRFSIGDIQ